MPVFQHRVNSYIYVSIRARHYWRAMPPLALLKCLQSGVSIRARHYWRAMHFQPNSLKRLKFFIISRERGDINGNYCIHHVQKTRASIQINELRSARTS